MKAVLLLCAALVVVSAQQMPKCLHNGFNNGELQQQWVPRRGLPKDDRRKHVRV